MTEHVNSILETTLIDDGVKAVLRSIDKELNSPNENIRNSSPALLVTAGEGCGFSTLGKVYSQILDNSIAMPIRGKKTFLELTFPKDNEKDEKGFYESPRRIAGIRNRFYGTMLISFREFDGPDLINSESFERLLYFIELNKKNIHFLFHVLPDFSEKERLILMLQKAVGSIEEVVLDKPDLEKGYTYVLGELENNGYVVNSMVQDELKKNIIPNIIEGKTYMGYKTLNGFVVRLNHEVAKASSCDELVIDEDVIANIKESFKKENELNSKDYGKFGFKG